MDATFAPASDEAGQVRRARQGDPHAWEDLVHRHQEPVFRFAYLLLGEADDAEDVAQEAFLRAYQALARFDEQRPLRPWLLSITANLARNRRRALGRYWHAIQRLARAEPQPRLDADDQVHARQEARQLWQAVRRLSGPDQQVIYLRHFLELSVEESAQAIGVAPGTVKSRLHRALSRLQDVIRQEYPSLAERFSYE